MFYCKSNSRRYAGLILIAFMACTAISAQTTNDQFTVILLPDTQFYSESYPNIFNTQTQWIVDHIADRNIQFVIGLGDIVNKGGTVAQWQNASAAANLLNGKVPYFFPLGNKDYQG